MAALWGLKVAQMFFAFLSNKYFISFLAIICVTLQNLFLLNIKLWLLWWSDEKFSFLLPKRSFYDHCEVMKEFPKTIIIGVLATARRIAWRTHYLEIVPLTSSEQCHFLSACFLNANECFFFSTVECANHAHLFTWSIYI